jgi:hypothetical protein
MATVEQRLGLPRKKPLLHAGKSASIAAQKANGTSIRAEARSLRVSPNAGIVSGDLE